MGERKSSWGDHVREWGADSEMSPQGRLGKTALTAVGPDPTMPKG